jgi:hypothetical protein
MRIFVFDWDDTLFCTSHHERALTKDIVYTDLCRTIISLIGIVKKSYDKVYIITCGTLDWVKKCVDENLTTDKNFLENIEVHSARQEYGDPNMWKMYAFSKILSRHFYNREIHEILVVGDSFGEISAAKYMGKIFPNIIVKTVKFVMRPSLDDVITQQKWMMNNFHNISHNLIDTDYTTEHDLKETKERDNYSIIEKFKYSEDLKYIFV